MATLNEHLGVELASVKSEVLYPLSSTYLSNQAVYLFTP
jgi:hypothetical protein